MNEHQTQQPLSEERELDLKQLVLTVLLHRRLLAGLCLIGCLLGATYGLLKAGAGGSGTPAAETAALSEEMQDYLGQMEIYQTQKESYESQIQNAMDAIRTQRDYIENSILLQCDPEHTRVGEAVIEITTDDMETWAYGERLVGSVDMMRLLYAYQSIVTDENTIDEIARNLQTEPVYVRELIRTTVDVGSAAVYIYVTTPDAERCEMILETLRTFMEEWHEETSRSYGAHESRFLNRKIRTETNKNIQSTRDTAISAITTWNNQINSAQKGLNDLKEPEKPKDTEVAIRGTGEAMEVAGTGHTAGRILRYAIPGALGGLLVMFFLLCVYYVLLGRILSAEEFTRRYGIKALTVLSDTLPASDRALLRHGRDGAYLQMNGEEQLAIAAANLSVYSPDVREILLVSSSNRVPVQKVSQTLQKGLSGVKLLSAQDLNENLQSLQALKEHTDVVIVEQLRASAFGATDRMVRTLHDWEKNVIGAVFIG